MTEQARTEQRLRATLRAIGDANERVHRAEAAHEATGRAVDTAITAHNESRTEVEAARAWLRSTLDLDLAELHKPTTP